MSSSISIGQDHVRPRILCYFDFNHFTPCIIYIFPILAFSISTTSADVPDIDARLLETMRQQLAELESLKAASWEARQQESLRAKEHRKMLLEKEVYSFQFSSSQF